MRGPPFLLLFLVSAAGEDREGWSQDQMEWARCKACEEAVGKLEGVVRREGSLREASAIEALDNVCAMSAVGVLPCEYAVDMLYDELIGYVVGGVVRSSNDFCMPLCPMRQAMHDSLRAADASSDIDAEAQRMFFELLRQYLPLVCVVVAVFLALNVCVQRLVRTRREELRRQQ
ncbi:hypothetical protein DIPPA_22108 [Diplonema papillatum]|nr:hypothetical protein DIPPA_22108 [Diplonema papillatum]